METDPILLEILKNKLCAVADEMGVTLHRTGYSPNIKERRDFSCGLFDGAGHLVAQASHIPVHLGSMPLSVASVLDRLSLGSGDMAILNDPYAGGTHLPDITVVAPVFLGADKPLFYVANRAHHADVGGMTSGSMPLSTSVFQEGLLIPPIKIIEAGTVNTGIMELILRNVRTRDEREGDFAAQFMANRVGIRRLEELVEVHGVGSVCRYAEALQDYSEKVMRAVIRTIPDGVYRFEDYLDDDGQGNESLPIRVALRVEGDQVLADLGGTHDQTQGCLNAVKAVTISAVLYSFCCLLPRRTPVNGGTMRPIGVETRPGSLLDPRFPAAVAAGNVETSQRVVDVILGALAEAIPEWIPAASQGTMNNIAVGGISREGGVPFSYYETVGGGMGAGPGNDGESAVHSHMTNTLNTPIEALEYAFPMVVETYQIRRDSGGRGAYRGGDGMVRQWRFLADAEVTVLSERRRHPPYGLCGGEPGALGANWVLSVDGGMKAMPGKFTIKLKKGEGLRMETPGGGGFGPFERHNNIH